MTRRKSLPCSRKSSRISKRATRCGKNTWRPTSRRMSKSLRINIPKAKKFAVDGIMPAAAALRAQDAKKASDILHGPMEQLFPPTRDQINALIDLQLNEAK